jgi:glycosyltransferase involved in cell wall biosynthesis
MLKIQLFNTYKFSGGAAIASFRIFESIRKLDIECKFESLDDSKTNLNLLQKLNGFIDRLVYRFYKKADVRSSFSTGWMGFKAFRSINKFNPDIVHLSWINSGYFSLFQIGKIDKPIVWTLHDMWPFTGGCHYDNSCSRYESNCGNCPELSSKSSHDVTSLNLLVKQRSYKNKNITVITPSKWLEACAKKSKLFRQFEVKTIPNPIDTDIYFPHAKKKSRQKLGLSFNKKYVLFSAHNNALTDRRKGFYLVAEKISEYLSARSSDLQLIILGDTAENNKELNLQQNCIFIPHLHCQEDIIVLNSAVDLLIAPSVQENLSNTVMEGMACGLPVVAFKIGGMPDLIIHKENGYLAQPYSPHDFINGVDWILENSLNINFTVTARNFVINNFSYAVVGEKYKNLYNEILLKDFVLS